MYITSCYTTGYTTGYTTAKIPLVHRLMSDPA